MPFLLNKTNNEKIELNSSWLNVGNTSEADIRLNSEELFLFTVEKREYEYFIERKKGNITLNNKAFVKSRLANGTEIKTGTLALIFFEHQETDEAESGFAIPEFMFIDKESEKFIQALISANSFARQVNSVLELETLLNVILQLAVKITGTEKGFLMLSENGGDGNVSLKATLNLENELSSIDNLSRFFLNLIGNNLNGNSFITFDSLHNSFFPGIRGITILKLQSGEEVSGYLGLINKNSVFEDKEVFLAETLASHSAIAIDNSLRFERIKSETNLRNNLQRHLSRNAIAGILKNRDSISLGGESRDCTVMITGISDFNSLTGKLRPTQVINILNEYFSEMTRIIFSFNGSIDKFLGEGIIAVFGVPFASEVHAAEAVQAAVKMKESSLQLREKFYREYGIKGFSIRFGISSGHLVYGNVGSPQRIDFRITGEVVNEAFFIEQNAPEGSIIISAAVMEKTEGSVEVKALELSGKDKKMPVFEVLSGAVQEDEKTSEGQVRRFVRVSVKTFVTVMKDGIRGHGLIRDISAGGLRIGMTGSYRTGDKISLTFLLSNKYTFRNISGIVKYIEKPEINALGFKDAKPHIILGVEFEKLETGILKQLLTFINEERAKQL